MSQTLVARVNAVLPKTEQRRLLAAMEFTPSGAAYGPTRDAERRTTFKGISFVPPATVRQRAVEGLELVAAGHRGGTDIGFGRAVHLATKPTVYPRDVYRMVDYFRRHAVDLQSAGAKRGDITPGVVAWLLWGGFEGAAWSNKVAAAMDAAMHRRNPGETARRSHPALWAEVVHEVTAGSRGGRPGQWSARKAQLSVALYKAAGGGYVGAKSPSNSLARWTREQWSTKSGKPSLKTGERYLPAAALAAFSDAEYAATTRAKRAGLRRGEQFTPQPPVLAAKTRRYRK